MTGPVTEPFATWRQVVAEATARLAAVGVTTAASDARRLVERAGAYEPSEYRDALDEVPTRRALGFFDAMLERRLAGEPLQYVVGVWSFRGLDLLVDERVLIPRPETEVVAGVALAEVDRLRAADRSSPVVVADLGTGSGAIALSIAAERERVAVVATDVSPGALAVAGANLAGLGRAATRVRLVEGSWFDALPDELAGAVGVIVSNPPYVADGAELPAEVAAWEPATALYAGPRGTEALEVILDGAPPWLTPAGAVVLELSPEQAPTLAARARAGGFASVRVVPDLAGRDRVLVARRAAPVSS